VRSALPVVLDACVLIPMPLADTLLRLAAGPRLFLPKWSDQIMVEVTRTLRETFGLSAQKAMYRESEIGWTPAILGTTYHAEDHPPHRDQPRDQ
jgi:hypothetical protein